MTVSSDADEIRRQLEDERDDLQSRLDELSRTEVAGSEGPLAYDDNFADSGQVAAEQGENQALAGQLREQLDAVDKALARLADGSYGRCEVCGEPIAPARLEAMPAATTCINHA
ncbi:MAG TPA: TraR/DksA C4-type zinc finger protein [Acidimicrobiales bacterium]|jgi:RNA polymerase-binding transcription factor DksA|nr:TraR/DksA C4-type zinc finger protein [Acidimicrobiales bacterium]